ncbi:hypothetical protein SBOR_9208 [Sclerotinia borealis F-4128]|uniref:AGC-kinase C-terminal domain-containing protein n=1 Tax=Sclerotinia borealis (strain F-4128) TaxID=1432307 RepID=W9C0S7_SCLBF|nr:hypothetical protein SBOR_9208 [Sclerotinia borealis F-4128]
MFSYLRPHRRIPSTPSTPSSPNPEVLAFEPRARPTDHGHPTRLQDVKYEYEISSSSSPPFLPPIARVSSAGYGNTFENLSFSGKITSNGHDPTGQNWDAKTNNGQKGGSEFGINQKSPSYASNQRPDSAGNGGTGSMKNTGFDHSRSQSNANYETSTKKFLGSMIPESDIKSTGRRPTGARNPSPPIEAPPPHSSRARLKMLNPMALLARRRTSQAIPQLTPESLTTNLSSNDNFDPRIKGTVVHDFSAPRGPRRNISYSDVSAVDGARAFQRSPYADSTTSDKAGNHTPVFTENFEEEQYPAAGPHVRKTNDLSDLTAPKPPYARESRRPADQNSTSKGNEELQNQVGDLRRLSAQNSSTDIGPPVTLNVEIPVPVESKRISIDPVATPPKSYPSSRQSGRPRNVSDVSAKNVPKHMRSTSSRFSFDMIGAAEQERLLEDRHRQKALEKKNNPDNNDDQQIHDEDEDFDYDDMMDDDGLEERIPGVNADYDEDDIFEGFDGGYEEGIPGINTTSLEETEVTQEQQEIEQIFPVEDGVQAGLLDGNVAGFTFQPHVASPMSPYTPGAATTPRDSNGQIIGFALTKYSPYLTSNPPNSVLTPISPDGNISSADKKLFEEHRAPESNPQGLGIVTEISDELGEETIQQQSSKSASFPHMSGLDADDDLYFDDGIIGLGGDEGEDAGGFDESVFDNNDTDPYGRPIKDQFMVTETSDTLATSSTGLLDEVKEDALLLELSSTTNRPTGGLAPQPSFSDNKASAAAPAQLITQGLTQDKLAAYQASLAAAAFSAAASGKFRRDSTQSVFHIDSDREENQPGLITDSGQTSSHYDHISPSYDDDFDYDDALEDDEFIAAANAEALANDPDGFYGQEFGFYSQPAVSSAEYINGGYFVPTGMDGIIRNQSGRIASREPNLTPITERSEYSNRNSLMLGSHLHAPSGGSPMISPGLAQLMIAQDYERASDMSLEALLKLRSRAWGGSQASVKSLGSNGNGNGSPKSVEESGSPVVGGPLTQPPWGHRRKGSAFNLVSEEVESEVDHVGNLTTNKSSPELGHKIMETRDSSSGNEHEGVAEKARRPSYTKQHQSTPSAESISYTKEDDPVNGERWVLERRRTVDSGEVEVLGREVLQGGAI